MHTAAMPRHKQSLRIYLWHNKWLYLRMKRHPRQKHSQCCPCGKNMRREYGLFAVALLYPLPKKLPASKRLPIETQYRLLFFS